MTSKAKARAGVCVCGHPVAAHFDEHDSRVSCASLAASVSSDPVRESAASRVQQPVRTQDRADVATPLRDRDLMQALGVKHSVFYRRKALGHYRFLELKPQLPDSNTLYSRRLLAQWLDGQVVTGEEPRRFFGAAAKRASASAPRRGPGRPRKGNTAASSSNLMLVSGHAESVEPEHL